MSDRADGLTICLRINSICLDLMHGQARVVIGWPRLNARTRIYKGARAARPPFLKKISRMNSEKINKISNVINNMPGFASNDEYWSILLAVDEMVNYGNSEPLDDLYEVYAESDDEHIAYDDIDSREVNLRDYFDKIPEGATALDVCREDLVRMVMELREVAISDDAWKARALVERQYEFIQ